MLVAVLGVVGHSTPMRASTLVVPHIAGLLTRYPMRRETGLGGTMALPDTGLVVCKRAGEKHFSGETEKI